MTKIQYTYKARRDALISIQLWRSSTDSLDLLMISNLCDDSDFLFPKMSIDPKQHGRFVADFIKKHADGKNLEWLKDFTGELSAQLEGGEDE